MRYLVAFVGLALLAGCGSSGVPGDATSAEDPRDGVEIRMGLARVHPAEQLRVYPPGTGITGAAGLPIAYLQLLRPARFQSANADERLVVMRVRIGTTGWVFDTGSIDAWFEDAARTRIPATPAPCRNPFPPQVGTDGDSVDGCLAYVIPSGSGRLQLRGQGPPGDPFKYFLPVPT